MALWYSERGPEHIYHHKSGRTETWHGVDDQERFDRHMADPVTRKKMEEYGWTDCKTIHYRYNHQGFRCDEFDDRPAGIAIGCSHTLGTGNREHETWPSVLAGMLGTHVWNLGLGATGLDTQFRILDHYIRILKPKFVAHAVPSIQRFEVCVEESWEPVIVSGLGRHELFRPFYKEYFINDSNSQMNAKRNLMAIRWLCHMHGTPYFAIDVQFAVDWKEQAARDLMHHGPQQQRRIAQFVHELMHDNPQGALDGHTRIRCS